MAKCIGIYLRISNEDVKKNNANDESNSIQAQRQIIHHYIEQDPYLSDLPQMEFQDDGFTGTNFERPGFQKMMDYIRSRQIHILIVKDFSRLGRDYLEVGNYLDHVFPFLGIRVISINDHFDSDHYSGFTPGMDVAFQNLIYDMYSRDLSKKVKSAISVKQKETGYVTCCPYGYKSMPGQKHKMAVDPETAPVVRSIFLDIIAGKSTSEIARGLNAAGILTPAEYSGKSRNTDKKAVWTHQRIIDIINNIKYTGCMVNHKRETKKIHDNAGSRVPESEWIIHENAHEAIVSTEEFETARAMLRKVRPYKRVASGKEYPYYCAHCGRKLQKTFGNDTYFSCPTPYWDERSETCKSVYWDKKSLEEIVLESLKVEISVMELNAKENYQAATSKGFTLRARMETLTRELKYGDNDKLQDYIDYKEGRISREDLAMRRAEQKRRMDSLRQELQEAKADYQKFLKDVEEHCETEKLVKKIHTYDDNKLVEIMYDAIARVNVIDGNEVEIVWKFNDPFEMYRDSAVR